MLNNFIDKIRRGIKKPPHIIAKRVLGELKAEGERFLAPYRAKKLKLAKLLQATNSKNLTELWSYLGKRAYFTSLEPIAIDEYEKICPHAYLTILNKAEDAVAHRVNLLGSGFVELGNKINWQQDYKTGHSWTRAYMRAIDYNNPERPSDVKFPWEVSRMQWLIPLGQAYLLAQNEKYALAARTILEDWIENNPYAYSVNWACTMEVALRIVTWTWLFHVFHKSISWQDTSFQEKFLRALFLHADFTARHLEYSDINGNHYVADATGLIFAGLFFGENKQAKQWLTLGWNILNDELPKQVFADGVDYEASVPYHRLVLELFLLPAFYRETLGLPVPNAYKERLINMARFTATYAKPDGSAPLWGDADDARVLPFGDQPINDHRYLLGLIGIRWNNNELLKLFSGSRSEIIWYNGLKASQILDNVSYQSPASTAFPDGGFYIMRNTVDHIFIDCGPLGLGGRGGHGHNDCLSFEAMLNGVPLISDCGAYLYTASYMDRNLFRSTAYHNTPQINDEEINRFIRWDYLWNLHNDAKPIVHQWETNSQFDVFCGSHTGYLRLEKPIQPKRTITLDHKQHSLLIQDEFDGFQKHIITIPLHLAPNVTVEKITETTLQLVSFGKSFTLEWQHPEVWVLQIEEARVSPSYGIAVPIIKLIWRNTKDSYQSLKITISPIR
jgi:uncharacterized heparinase superfamily protein